MNKDLPNHDESREELKDTKLDYTDVGNIITLPYEDYFRFALYNIKDTLFYRDVLTPEQIAKGDAEFAKMPILMRGHNVMIDPATGEVVPVTGGMR